MLFLINYIVCVAVDVVVTGYVVLFVVLAVDDTRFMNFMGCLYKKLDGTKKSHLQKRFICKVGRDKNGTRQFLFQIHGKNQTKQFFFFFSG